MLPLGELHQIVIDTTFISRETEKYKMLIKTICTQQSNSHRLNTNTSSSLYIIKQRGVCLHRRLLVVDM